MKKIVFFLTINIFIFGCSIDRTISPLFENEQKLLKEFHNLDSSNKLKITEENEPGEKLNLCITLVNKKTKQILAGQKIHLYQTSSQGEYEPRVANDESTARLSATTQTDLRGRIFVETILPGDYGSSEDNRHIHTTIFGAKPEGYDIGFKQYSTFMGKQFSASSDQHFLADLKRDKAGNLVAFLTIEAKFPQPLSKD